MASNNELVVRNEAGEVIGRPLVSAKTQALWASRTATVRQLQDSAIVGWIYSRCEEIARAGGDQKAFLDQTVTVADECRY